MSVLKYKGRNISGVNEIKTITAEEFHENEAEYRASGETYWVVDEDGTKGFYPAEMVSIDEIEGLEAENAQGAFSSLSSSVSSLSDSLANVGQTVELLPIMAVPTDYTRVAISNLGDCRFIEIILVNGLLNNKIGGHCLIPVEVFRNMTDSVRVLAFDTTSWYACVSVGYFNDTTVVLNRISIAGWSDIYIRILGVK